MHRPQLSVGNAWNWRHPEALWLTSRRSNVRHYIDWRENVFADHDDTRLQSRLGPSRAQSSWFDPQAFHTARLMRAQAGLPDTDLASENSEDALTWSVFSQLAKSNEDWWRIFGLSEQPEIAFWPRDPSATSATAQAYREAGKQVEPFHDPQHRSEVDLLLTTTREQILVEVKWAGAPLDGGRRHVSNDPERNTNILRHLGKLAAKHQLTISGIPDVLERGGYQMLRHLLYAQELSTEQRPTNVAYLVCGRAVSLQADDTASRELYRHREFVPMFGCTPPEVVLWEELTALLEPALLDVPQPAGTFHEGATLREYLAGRMLDGHAHPLAPASSTGLELKLDRVRADRYADGWMKSIETWTIQEPLEKLRAKYSRGGSLVFDHYVFHYPHRDPNWITPVDMAAVDQLMTGNLSINGERWSRIADPACQDRVQAVLARIPTGVTIEDPRWDGLVAEAVGALVQREVQLAIATKLLMVKRPWLIPMYDSRLRAAFDDEQDVATLQGEMRRLLATNRAAIERLRSTVADEFALVISPLRVLDQLVWFDWNLNTVPDNEGMCRVFGFPEWAFDTNDPVRGIRRVD